MTTFALLSVMALRQTKIAEGPAIRPAVKTFALVGLIALGCQIALGAWTSTNYAALACSDFPQCQGEWVPQADFTHGFHLFRELGYTAEGQLLSQSALTAIHWVHRMGAASVALILFSLAWVLLRAPGLQKFGIGIFIALGIQLAIGISLILWQLPLPLAVMHNGGAAVLLFSLVAANTATQTRPVLKRIH
jgi:cytochrome c oxidase assembly protein subunit 15